MNEHEARARQVKVARLVTYLLDAVALTEPDPQIRVEASLRWCDRATDAMWQTVADLADVRLPSQITRDAVRSHLEGMVVAERRKAAERDAEKWGGAFDGLPQFS